MKTENKIDLSLSYINKLKVWESDYGRQNGWIVEKNSKPVALLTDPEYVDMFWVSYQIELIDQSENLVSQMQTQDFWNEFHSKGFVLRNRTIPSFEKSDMVLVSMHESVGRVSFRSLHIHINSPTIFDGLLLMARSTWSRLKNS